MKSIGVYYPLRLIVGLVFIGTALCAEITYELHRGTIDERTIKQLPSLAQVYREYPYLYCPSAEQAERYWAGLSGADTIWSVAYDGSTLIGAMIALPVRGSIDPVLQTHPKFIAGKALMLEEAMVSLSYQKQGIGRELMRLLLHEACVGGYSEAYLLTVVRSLNHPLKPDSFIDLDAVWTRLGWSRTGLTGLRTWPTRCGTSEDECVAVIDNMVEYWHKKLS